MTSPEILFTPSPVPRPPSEAKNRSLISSPEPRVPSERADINPHTPSSRPNNVSMWPWQRKPKRAARRSSLLGVEAMASRSQRRGRRLVWPPAYYDDTTCYELRRRRDVRLQASPVVNIRLSERPTDHHGKCGERRDGGGRQQRDTERFGPFERGSLPWLGSKNMSAMRCGGHLGKRS